MTGRRSERRPKKLTDNLPPPPELELAACRGLDPMMFFPERGDKTTAAKAKRVCREMCPVETECLDWALAVGFRYGIFGGMSEKQRRDEKARRRKDGGPPDRSERPPSESLDSRV